MGESILLGIAAGYAARGWPVFPLHAPLGGRCTCGRDDCGNVGKHPLTRNGLLDATTDAEQIRAWWRSAPRANIGLVTGMPSGLVVLDNDRDKGGDESLQALQHAHGMLPITMEAITGSGGGHMFFAHPGVPIRNKQGWSAYPGLDVRGDGGYVVAAGSTHRSGNRYEWAPYCDPETQPAVAMPPWLVEMLSAPAAPVWNGAVDSRTDAALAPMLTGCGWLRHCRDDGASLGYGPWFAMLTLLSRCEGGAAAAHQWGKTHPTYTPHDTEQAFRHALHDASPRTCLDIRKNLDGEPYCASCPHWGRIKTPLAHTGRLAALDALAPPERARASVGLVEVSAPIAAALAQLEPHAPTNGTPPPDAPIPLETAADDRRLHLTDYGNAERLVRRHGKNLRFCHDWGRWLVWDGRRWVSDGSEEVARRAKDTARSIYGEALVVSGDSEQAAGVREALVKWAGKSEGQDRLAAMVKLARSEPLVAVVSEVLDADPWILNCENGSVDLRTGALRPHSRADRITRLCPAPFDQQATAPVWEAFLRRVLPDDEVRAFVQRAAGYSATGHTGEEAVFFPYGTGRNGKSKFLGAIESALGDYAQSARPETFLSKRGDTIPNDVAALAGARFVSSREAEEGRRLDVGLVKQMTGGDMMEARFLGKEFFRFKPRFKVWFAVNHKPVIRDSTESIWERVKLIPFTAYIPPGERDKHLDEKLRAEAAGIIRWLVEGCLLWQSEGLGSADAIIAATQGYREEMDVIAGFATDCCVTHPEARATSRELYAAYRKWCEGNGEQPLSKNLFGMRLSERGLQSVRIGDDGARGWRGIGLAEGSASEELAFD